MKPDKNQFCIIELGLGYWEKITFSPDDHIDLNENMNNFIVYRGQSHEFSTNSPNDYIWVTSDKDYAENYGGVKSYILPKSFNILDTDINYDTWKELLDEFYNEENSGYEYEDEKFEPTTDLIDFLKLKGYNGFSHQTSGGDNICVFDKTVLK